MKKLIWLRALPEFMQNLVMPITFLVGIGLFAPAFASANESVISCSDNLEAENRICAEVILEKPLNAKTEAQFKVRFFQSSHAPLSIEHLDMELWMEMENGHSHGSAPLRIETVSPLIYLVRNAWFLNMAGHWDLKVLVVAGGKRNFIKIPLKVLP